MNVLITNRFSPAMAAMVAVAAVGLPIALATAGEPIRFGGEKSKSSPDVQSKVPQDRFLPTSRIPSTTPLDAFNSSGANMNLRRLSPKEEKQLKNKQLEEKNWAVVNRGELQEQDDQETEFGIRDYSADSLEKEEKGAGAIWFGSNQERSGKSAGQSRGPNGNSRATGPNRPQPAPRAVDSDVNIGAAKISSFDSGATPGQSQGKEVTFQNLAPGSDANNVLKELFNNGPAGTRLPDEPSRGRDSFGLRSINTQPGLGSSGSGRGYGLNSDLTRPSVVSSPSLIEGLKSQPGSLPSRLSPTFDSPRYDLNSVTRSSVSPLAPPKNDNSVSSTRELFAPPPRPGSLGSR